MINPKILSRISLLVLLLLTACAMIPGMGGAAEVEGTPEPTPNPLTPTPVMNGFQQLRSKACKIASLKSIATTSHQSSLFAWSGDGKQIAYILPTNLHNMYSGSLVVASSADYLPSAPLAVNVTGSLIWSPSGQRIAFVALRPADNVYTVMVAEPGSTGVTDLFPGNKAKLDSFSSPKVILYWNVENQLRVQASCGDGCIQVLNVSVTGGTAGELPAPEPTQVALNWMARRNERTYDEKAYPEGMNTPNWSTDGTRVVYFDQDGFLWVAMIPEREAFQLVMDSSALPVWLPDNYNRETVWAGSNLLGVRVGGILDIFEVPCRK